MMQTVREIIDMTLRTKYIFFIIAIGNLLAILGFHFLSYFPALRTSTSSLSFILAIAIFPTFFVGIKSVQKLVDVNNPKNLWKDALKGTPKFLKILLILSIPYVIFNFIFSLFYLNAALSPEHIGGLYALVDKGVPIREITEQQYFEHIAYEFRGMSGHILFFQLMAVALLSSAINIETKDSEGDKTKETE